MNKTFFAVLTMISILCIPAFGTEKPVIPGKVNADLLNLRLGPGLQHPVIGKVADKTELRIRRIIGNWLEVEAPETLAIYVSEARINRNGKLTGELNMRSAMDSKAPCFGTLPAGTAVEKTGSSKNGWVRIKVPASADIKVYAASFLVNYDPAKFDEKGNIAGTAAAAEENTQKVEAQSPAKEEKNIPEESKTVVNPAVEEVKADAEEKFAPEKEEVIELQGVLVKWKYSSSPKTDYTLLTAPEGLNQAFVSSDDPALLKAMENKKVKISGRADGRFGENGAIIVKAGSITEIK
ncbi:MAG: hypothetical protein E7043_01345 [Lentisphaerae bacterium]|nr:hypothetical protein [Lentisphaerota bacterium]